MAMSVSLERMPGFNAEASLYKTSVTVRGRVDDAKKMAKEAVLQASHWICKPYSDTGDCHWYNINTGKWAGPCACLLIG